MPTVIAKRRYLNRQEVLARLRQMKGGVSLSKWAAQYRLDVKELSKLLNGDPHRYPSKELLAVLRLGQEEVLWPEL